MRTVPHVLVIACIGALWVPASAAGQDPPARRAGSGTTVPLAGAVPTEVELHRAKPSGAKPKRPRITRLTPASGPVAGGTRVVVRGKNLQNLRRVTVGGRRAVVLSRGPHRIVVRTPEAARCARTAARVLVRTTGGASRASARARFTYRARTVQPMIAAGDSFSIALRRDGAVLAWGSGSYGVLGQGHDDQPATPVRVKRLGCVTAVAAGSEHAAALTAGGQVWSWGRSAAGQAGDGALGVRLLPVRTLLAERVVQISAAGDKTVARTADGEVLAWGWETADEFGGGHDMTKTPVRLTTLRQVRTVVAGSSNVMVIKSDGSVWGMGSGPALGMDVSHSSALPRHVPDLSGVTRLRVGARSVNAVTADGTLWGWGVNDAQSGGAPGLGYSGPPVRTPTRTSLSAVTGVAGITAEGLALRSDGTVWGWGWCAFCDPAGGAAGDGARLSPTRVPGLSGIVGIAAAHGRFHALHADGRVSVWGFGWVLPGGDFKQSVTTPTEVPGLDLIP